MVRWGMATVGALCLSCGGSSPLTSPSALSTVSSANTPLNGGPFNPDAGLPLLPTETFVGAGDIAQCANGGAPDATARLLDAIGGTVFALGDNAYPSGSTE